VYGQTKVEAERVVRATLERHLIVRTNMYGWNLQQKRSLAEWALYHLEQGNPIPGFTDVTFNALFVNDLATLILRMLEVGASGTYHLGASNSCSKFEFVRTVASVFGLNPELIRPASIEEIPFKAPRPRHTSLLSTKASAFLGCSMPSILAGIQTFARAREEGYVSRLKSYGVF
jgi:dTDP-4-dehydrorhamnose reductase